MYNLMPQRFWKTSTAVQEQTVINQSHTKQNCKKIKTISLQRILDTNQSGYKVSKTAKPPENNHITLSTGHY